MRAATKVVMSGFSTFLFIVAGCMLVGTIAIGWLYGSQRGTEGVVTSDEVLMSTSGYAIASTHEDLESVIDEESNPDTMGKILFRAQSQDGSPLFVGVGPSGDIGEYLEEIEHTEVTRLDSQARLTTTEHSGDSSPTPPSDLDFWTVSSEGAGQRTLDWDAGSGAWTLVVMNPDATPGLDVAASLELSTTPSIPVGLWLTGVSTALIAASAVVIGVIASRPAEGVDLSDPGSPEAA